MTKFAFVLLSSILLTGCTPLSWEDFQDQENTPQQRFAKPLKGEPLDKFAGESIVGLRF